jgi:hypothetical protein
MSLLSCSEADVFVTRTPPGATVVGGPSKGAASPSTVIFSFASHVLNGTLGAPVVAAQCLLQPLTDARQQVPSLMLLLLSALGCPAGPDTGMTMHEGHQRWTIAHSSTAWQPHSSL